MNIWIEIEKLKGQTLRTLDQHKPFEIIEVDSNELVILPRSTKISRPIRREGIETAYRHLITTGQLTIKEIEEEYTPRSQVYTATILAGLASVHHSLRPIRLWITRNS
ncbi:MAG: hypothetical protein ACYC6R_05775 [Anaerolineales bacterium]